MTVVKFLGSQKSYTRIFYCAGDNVPNPHIIQGPTVMIYSLVSMGVQLTKERKEELLNTIRGELMGSKCFQILEA